MTSATASKPRILTDNSILKQTPDTARWQTALRAAITDPAELLSRLKLDVKLLPGAQRASQLFPLRVPAGYVARMKPGNPQDPLLRQVLPIDEETLLTEGFGLDAVGDMHSLRGKGLLQKYQGRALLITTGACAIHCRFCFRRSFPYESQTATRNSWQESLDILRGDASIREIILSGGDPLSLNDDKLAELSGALNSIPHLERLRIHTRQPIVLPERVDERLLSWLSESRLKPVIVLHCNHAQELDSDTSAAINKLQQTGATLLNQAVLLKGVNDNPDALAELSEALFAAGVLPYYLHLLDRVQGTAHFEVGEEQAQILMRKIAARLPGYLVPRLVKEEIGKSNKTNVLW